VGLAGRPASLYLLGSKDVSRGVSQLSPPLSLSLSRSYFPISEKTARKCPIIIIIIMYRQAQCGPGSSVGIATDYGLDGPGIESRWGQDFPPVQTGSGAHPASCACS